MKTFIQNMHTPEAGQIIGKIVNAVIALTGAIYCIYGIYLQVVNNL